MLRSLAIAAVIALLPAAAAAHCQIPCGIYDDDARVTSMLEDTETVAKSARLIQELASAQDAQSRQQFTRWVTNKEEHAQKVIDTIADYFLTQRVKPDQDDYAERLARHHAVIVAAMKAKQNADPAFAEELRRAIEALRTYYPEHGHTH